MLADLMNFGAQNTYETFIQRAKMLSELETFPVLRQRAAAVGFKINKAGHSHSSLSHITLTHHSHTSLSLIALTHHSHSSLSLITLTHLSHPPLSPTTRTHHSRTHH